MIIDNLLTGKNILVTGVSRSIGIGTAITKLCARSGARVAIHGHPEYDREIYSTDKIEGWSNSNLVEILTQEGHEVFEIAPSDLALDNEPERVIQQAKDALGSLNGLVLNHAYSTSLPIGEWTKEHIDNHLNVNVRASMLMIQAFSEQFNSEEDGSIVLFTSGQYLGPMINEIAYAVSKEAIRGLCEQVSAALAPKNIRVNCINPGPVDTGYLERDLYEMVAKMFPKGRWGTPEDAARLVAFLLSEQAMWITGQTIASEGGFNRYKG